MEGHAMKLAILLSAAAISLAGCVVVPAGPPAYGYGYGYGYDGPVAYGAPVVIAPSVGFYGRWYGGNRGWGGRGRW
jgi:hypothetical protein